MATCSEPGGHSHSHGVDCVGLSLSLLCLLHCLLGPLLVVALPWLGNWIETPLAHLLFFFLVLPVALISFYRSYLYHRQLLPIVGATLGVALLVLGMASERYHLLHLNHLLPATTAWWQTISPHLIPSCGSLLLVMAHYFNIKNCTIVRKQGLLSRP